MKKVIFSALALGLIVWSCKKEVVEPVNSEKDSIVQSEIGNENRTSVDIQKVNLGEVTDAVKKSEDFNSLVINQKNKAYGGLFNYSEVEWSNPHIESVEKNAFFVAYNVIDKNSNNVKGKLTAVFVSNTMKIYYSDLTQVEDIINNGGGVISHYYKNKNNVINVEYTNQPGKKAIAVVSGAANMKPYWECVEDSAWTLYSTCNWDPECSVICFGLNLYGGYCYGAIITASMVHCATR